METSQKKKKRVKQSIYDIKFTILNEIKVIDSSVYICMYTLCQQNLVILNCFAHESVISFHSY